MLKHQPSGARGTRSPPATSHCLEHPIACNIQSGNLGDQKWPFMNTYKRSDIQKWIIDSFLKGKQEIKVQYRRDCNDFTGIYVYKYSGLNGNM